MAEVIGTAYFWQGFVCRRVQQVTAQQFAGYAQLALTPTLNWRTGWTHVFANARLGTFRVTFVPRHS